MATLYKVPTQNNSQYTLDAQLAQAGTTMTLNQSVAGVVQSPGVCVVDRVDTSGNKTASKREYVAFTGVSGADLTGLTRGLAGSSDQVHAVGAIVEFVPDVVQEQALYNVITTEHSVNGVHASLVSLTITETLNAVIASAASGNFASLRSLAVASTASLRNLAVSSLLQASGASVTGMPFHPTWIIPGAVSAATAAVGKPMDMPFPGQIDFISAVLRSPVSGASLVLDINKNFTTIFSDQNTRLTILGGGTYVSTASIGVKTFNAGDVFSVDVDAGGSLADITVKFRAR